MNSDTKHRQQEIATICKQHLREKYPDKPRLVDGFIAEWEDTGTGQDITRWSRFNEESGIELEMLNQLEEEFEKWLNP